MMSEREALLKNLLHELKDAPLEYLRMWHEAIRYFNAHAPGPVTTGGPANVDEAAIWDELVAATYEARAREREAFQKKIDQLF